MAYSRAEASYGTSRVKDIMQFPSLMPEKLRYCESARNEDELFSLLKEQGEDLVLFFEVASEDETWADEHASLMRRMLEWLTEEDFNERLEIGLNLRVAQAVRKHHSVLSSLLPKNIQIQLKDGFVAVNGLLLVKVSELFRHFLRKCREMQKKSFSLPLVTLDIFSPICEFMVTGEVVNLWRKNPDELIALLRQSNAWQVHGVVELCEATLKRYIDQENVFEMLERGMKEHWPILKQGCIDFINKNREGVRLSSYGIDRLTVRLEKVSDEALEIFNKVRRIISDLACSDEVTGNPIFSQIVKKCPKLIAVDVSETTHFSNYFFDIPNTIQSLNVSQCFWITKETLKQLAAICPNITELLLANNSQLSYADWGELLKFKYLQKLDISLCHSIKDEDLAIILKACPALTELKLDDCDRIGQAGFFEIARLTPKLLILDLSRTNITDAAVVDIAMKCRSLHTLKVSRCEQLSEKSIISVIRYGQGLRHLDLTRCHLARTFLDEIKQQNPQLEIVY